MLILCGILHVETMFENEGEGFLHACISSCRDKWSKLSTRYNNDVNRPLKSPDGEIAKYSNVCIISKSGSFLIGKNPQ